MRSLSATGLESVQRRVEQRAGERRRAEEDIAREGIFAAAGPAAAIRRTAHMTLAEGRALTRRSVTTDGRTYEAILGPDDSDPINFIARGAVGARAVCRLLCREQPIGTGVLVAPGIVLTNNHVLADADEAATFVAELDYELDEDDVLRQPTQRFRLLPDRLFVTSAAEQPGFDFTLAAVDARAVGSGAPLEAFGWVPLDGRPDKILRGEPAIVVQHPRGEPKRVCLFSAEVVDKLDDYLHYTTDTDHGSSGSAVFNRSWQFVALHHAAVETDPIRRGHRTVVNEGIRVSTILRTLAERAAREEHAAEALRALQAPAVVGDGRPQRVAIVASGPPATPRADETLRRPERTKIQTLPPDYFVGRDPAHFGYDPAFLGAHVPLPTLPGALADDVARTPEGETELRYTHASIVFSASRGLAIATAVNIDGAQAQRLSRTDRAFEAADRWRFDPRVPVDVQLGAELYDQTAFDYGHMVRREDPVWGDSNTARMANDDTFFMTNCTPQHHDLNTRTWLALENAVLDAARDGKRKVSVFTGPVLTPEDPEILGVQVPTAFWKIVAYVEAGRLRAQGFMQWQTKLVETMTVREGIGQELQRVAEYQVPIREIARVTSLDLGPLVAADTLGGGRRRAVPEAVTELRGRVAREEIAPTAERPPPRAVAAEAPRPTQEALLEKVVETLQELVRVVSRAPLEGGNGIARRPRAGGVESPR